MVEYGNPQDRQRTVQQSLSPPSRKWDLFLNTQGRVMQLNNSASQETLQPNHHYPRQSARASTAQLPPGRAGATEECVVAAGISECRRAGERNCARSRKFRCGADANQLARCQVDRVRAIAFRR